MVHKGILEKQLPPACTAQEGRQIVIHKFCTCIDGIDPPHSTDIGPYNRKEGHQETPILPKRRIQMIMCGSKCLHTFNTLKRIRVGNGNPLVI